MLFVFLLCQRSPGLQAQILQSVFLFNYKFILACRGCKQKGLSQTFVLCRTSSPIRSRKNTEPTGALLSRLLSYSSIILTVHIVILLLKLGTWGSVLYQIRLLVHLVQNICTTLPVRHPPGFLNHTRGAADKKQMLIASKVYVFH